MDKRAREPQPAPGGLEAKLSAGVGTNISPGCGVSATPARPPCGRTATGGRRGGDHTRSEGDTPQAVGFTRARHHAAPDAVAPLYPKAVQDARFLALPAGDVHTGSRRLDRVSLVGRPPEGPKRRCLFPATGQKRRKVMAGGRKRARSLRPAAVGRPPGSLTERAPGWTVGTVARPTQRIVVQPHSGTGRSGSVIARRTLRQARPARANRIEQEGRCDGWKWPPSLLTSTRG